MENSKSFTNGVEIFLAGRKSIWTTFERFDPNNTGDMIAEINQALAIHVENLIAMEYLYWYRRGITPIYAREKQVRDDINNKINVNHAEEIVDFKNGYFYTQPCFYVSRKEGKEISDKVGTLNEFLYRSGKQTADNKIVDWFHTVGKGDLFVKANDDKDVPFLAYSLDPRSAFVARSLDADQHPVYAVHTVSVQEPDDKNNKVGKLLLDVWDDRNVYTIAGTYKGKLATPHPDYVCTAVNVIDVKPNPLKKIPIIEYYYNSVQMGSFEAVIPLLDAINNLQSDRLDGVDQFIQSLLVFYNCELGTDEDGKEITPAMLREQGALFLQSIGENKADLKEISSQLDQSQTQIFIDNLYQQVLSICGMPLSNSDRGYSNASTATAQLARDGWYQADTVARNTEDLFLESNRQFDEIITTILREKNILDLKTTDFTLQFVRNETVNIQSKAQALQTLLSAGMHPELAFKKSGVSNDPVADVKMSEPYLKMVWGDPDNPNPDGTIPPSTSASGEDSDGMEGTRSYKRKRNGKWEEVSGYTKQTKVTEQ